MASAGNTHEVFNQSPPFAGLNLCTADPALGALVEGLPLAVLDDLALMGEQWGTPETFELGRIANQQPPAFRPFDANGARIDSIDFHPAYHALMRRSIGAGLHCSVWDTGGDDSAARAVSRVARLYIAAQAESGHLMSATMTNAAVAALAQSPSLADTWLPRIRTRRYDSSQRPLADKAGALIGMGFTEKQGGSDYGASTTAAVDAGDGMWRLTGHKWFLTAPTSDAFVVLAQTVDGLSCFLMPRFLSDGSLNGVRVMRLKDKLGGALDGHRRGRDRTCRRMARRRARAGAGGDRRHDDAGAARQRGRIGSDDAHRPRRGDPSHPLSQGVRPSPVRPAADAARAGRHGARCGRRGGAGLPPGGIVRSRARRRQPRRPTRG